MGWRGALGTHRGAPGAVGAHGAVGGVDMVLVGNVVQAGRQVYIGDVYR